MKIPVIDINELQAHDFVIIQDFECLSLNKIWIQFEVIRTCELKQSLIEVKEPNIVRQKITQELNKRVWVEKETIQGWCE